MEVAELLVVAIQHLPKDLYFPENDSLIQSLYGQTGIPNTRDLILISREPEKIQKELFNMSLSATAPSTAYEWVWILPLIGRTSASVSRCCSLWPAR